VIFALDALTEGTRFDWSHGFFCVALAKGNALFFVIASTTTSSGWPDFHELARMPEAGSQVRP